MLPSDVEERKRAEDALGRNDSDLQLTIDSIPALVWSARPDGTADFFNQHYLNYVGLSREDLRDWQWTSVIHPEDRHVIAAAWEAFKVAGTGGDVEARIRRYDGVYRWFHFRSNPLRGADGEIVKWYGVNVDIEDQKRAAIMLAGEKQLLEWIASGRPLKDVLGKLCSLVEAASPDCHCEARTLDGNGLRYEFAVAPSLPASFTQPIAAVPVQEDLSPCGTAAAEKAEVIAQDIESDPRWHGTPAQARLLDHGLKWVRCTPIPSNGGSVLGTLCVYRREPPGPQLDQEDIHGRAGNIASIAIERLRAEDELRRRAYLLATAERISETGSFSWDLNNNKLVWSTQMYRIHELREGLEPVYPNLLATVHPDDAQMINERVQRAFRGEPTPDDGYRLIMPDGRIKYLSTAYQVVNHEDGRRECVGVAQDVTRRRLAEDSLDKIRSELAHLTRVTSLGELAASITHEVNQPLGAIVANASTCLRRLAAQPPDIEGAVRIVERTLRDGNRASAVIGRLRGMFRKQDFCSGPLNLNEAAEEVIAICAHDLQRRRITLNVNLDAALPLVVGDRIQLQQVILNLALNAADAIGGMQPPQRQISIETGEVTPGIAELRVRDTGSGVSPENLSKIFEPFYTTKPDGMGIGLSVSRSIIEGHRGKIWARPNDGPGATFGFSIPCALGDS